MTDSKQIDYATWDWLPVAALEMQQYIDRLLAESGIRAHDVSARAKSIASFQRKQQLKGYGDPMTQITDIVAIRIITYSTIDRDRARDLIRSRFAIPDGEDRNPGAEKPENLRGYDCWHLVITGEQPGADSGWLVAGGNLEKYFTECGGLEIQIRTVAGHAWAEFEHARRYKGAQYAAISEQDREVIDRLFGAASDSQRALDSIFDAIDRFLASPTVDEQHAPVLEAPRDELTADDGLPLDVASLSALLSDRFPGDVPGSEKGIEFALELALACGLTTLAAAEVALDAIDHEQVVTLMDTNVPVTRVRRFDDDLLTRFGEDYIERTGGIGAVPSRRQQLAWRFDRLRGKARYKTYTFAGSDCPEQLREGTFTAALAVRELVRVIAQQNGLEAVLDADAISRRDDLRGSARARRVPIDDQESLWVITNLSREYSETLMRRLLERSPELDLRVLREGSVVAGERPRTPEPADSVAAS